MIDKKTNEWNKKTLEEAYKVGEFNKQVLKDAVTALREAYKKGNITHTQDWFNKISRIFFRRTKHVCKRDV